MIAARAARAEDALAGVLPPTAVAGVVTAGTRSGTSVVARTARPTVPGVPRRDSRTVARAGRRAGTGTTIGAPRAAGAGTRSPVAPRNAVAGTTAPRPVAASGPRPTTGLVTPTAIAATEDLARARTRASTTAVTARPAGTATDPGSTGTGELSRGRTRPASRERANPRPARADVGNRPTVATIAVGAASARRRRAVRAAPSAVATSGTGSGGEPGTAIRRVASPPGDVPGPSRGPTVRAA